MKALIKFVLLTVSCTVMLTTGAIEARAAGAATEEETTASDAASDTAPDAEQAAADSGRKFLTYVYASERVEQMASFQQTTLTLSLDADVLLAFGLIAEDAAAQLTERYEAAEQEAAALAATADTTYEAFMHAFAIRAATVTQSVYGEAAPAAGAMTDGDDEMNSTASAGDAEAASAVQAWLAIAAEADSSALTQALLDEEEACQEASASAVKHRAGLLDEAAYLSSYEACLQASMLAIDAKEMYLVSLLDAWQSENGTPFSLAMLLASLDSMEQEVLQLPPGTLSAAWIDALEASARLSMTSLAGSVAVSAELEGEILSPTAVALPGATFSLLTPPIHLESGGVFVPIKPYAQALGFQVNWIADSSSIMLERGHEGIVLQLASRVAIVNDQETELDAAPFIWLQQTYVPLSLFKQAAGTAVYWHEQDKQGAILPE